jgi:uncharacterized OsmC-like protein
MTLENVRKFRANTIRFTVDLDPETHKQLKLIALEQQCPATEVVRCAINQLIAKLHNEI